MQRWVALPGVLLMVVLTAACGSIASAVPTAPSKVAFPTLTGRWRVSSSIIALRNIEKDATLTWGGCSGWLTIDLQNDAAFRGSLSTQGSGWNSDRFCTASGTFAGTLLSADGTTAQARLDGDFQNWPRPSVTPSCELISAGDGMWSGSATSDAIRLQVRDVLRCPVNGDGGIAGMPMADFERTVSLSFQPAT